MKNKSLKLPREMSRIKGAERTNWMKWGPYLSERQWGTVREDYSADGNAWNFVTHEMARSKAHRWGEEGICGISDENQNLCFSIAYWNGNDPFLKERLFGLSGNEGNHGEDVKEYYYYLDNTPSHGYMKFLYKYPQQRFPYETLVENNRNRNKSLPEYELIDTGIFDDDRYFDIEVEYIKQNPEDLYIKITAFNRYKMPARLSIVPTLWFRNVWSWSPVKSHSQITLIDNKAKCINSYLIAEHESLEKYYLYFPQGGKPLFCDNVSNVKRLYNLSNPQGFFKDGINNYIVNKDLKAINNRQIGTKAGILYDLDIPANSEHELVLRFCAKPKQKPLATIKRAHFQAKAYADEFFEHLHGCVTDKDLKNIQRQAYSGLMWSKQWYYYDVYRWLEGDPLQPLPPETRKNGRNSDWTHLKNGDVILMPDKWEYPWYAAWDMGFHAIPYAQFDPEFAKGQILLMTKDWYMHPNGQLPAYEWNFDDVNPPVHGWAAWRIYQIDKKNSGGKGDLNFLERIFHKLLLNFNWWVNKKDADGRNLFQGGFLGLDNIGVFDRSSGLPPGARLDQADGTSWMAMYSLNLMKIALELAVHNRSYEDIAIKFFGHFLLIAKALTNIGGANIGLWNEEDEFFYDVIHFNTGETSHLRVRSMVGLIPLFAIETIEPEQIDQLPEFSKRLKWYQDYRPDLANLVSRWYEQGRGERRLLSLLRGHRMKCLLRRILDETEFLSPYGVRALSKYHENNPFVFNMHGKESVVKYQPGESDTTLFGGNSNWRGPIWFPLNYLLIESLQKFHHFYGDEFKVECPTGSGNYLTILEVSEELSRRLVKIFKQDDKGERPLYRHFPKGQTDPHFKDLIHFYEYFHGDNGRGVGASHQTGWSALVAKLLQQREDQNLGQTEFMRGEN
jgi:hypothetical protein